jgi:hypothetical protein
MESFPQTAASQDVTAVAGHAIQDNGVLELNHPACSVVDRPFDPPEDAKHLSTEGNHLYGKRQTSVLSIPVQCGGDLFRRLHED